MGVIGAAHVTGTCAVAFVVCTFMTQALPSLMTQALPSLPVCAQTERVCAQTEWVCAQTEWVCAQTEWVCAQTEWVCAQGALLRHGSHPVATCPADDHALKRLREEAERLKFRLAVRGGEGKQWLPCAAVFRAVADLPRCCGGAPADPSGSHTLLQHA
eukprot:gene4577-11243_t